MWAHFINAALGIWLMAAPGVLGFGGAAENNDRIVGPIVATLAWIATAQCTRNIRFWILPFSVWLVASPIFLDHTLAAAANDVAVGLAMSALVFVRGKLTTRFGGRWIELIRRPSSHRRISAE